mgnify:CR=1 FL=1
MTGDFPHYPQESSEPAPSSAITPEGLRAAYLGVYALLKDARHTLPELEPDNPIEMRVRKAEAYTDMLAFKDDAQEIGDWLAEAKSARMKARLDQQAHQVAGMEAMIVIQLQLAQEVARDNLDRWRAEAEAMMRRDLSD